MFLKQSLAYVYPLGLAMQNPSVSQWVTIIIYYYDFSDSILYIIKHNMKIVVTYKLFS